MEESHSRNCKTSVEGMVGTTVTYVIFPVFGEHILSNQSHRFFTHPVLSVSLCVIAWILNGSTIKYKLINDNIHKDYK